VVALTERWEKGVKKKKAYYPKKGSFKKGVRGRRKNHERTGVHRIIWGGLNDSVQFANALQQDPRVVVRTRKSTEHATP